MGLVQIIFCVVVLAVTAAYVVAAVNQKRVGNVPLTVIAMVVAALFVAVIAVIYGGEVVACLDSTPEDPFWVAPSLVFLTAATYAVAAVVLFVVARVTANIVAMSNKSRK